MESISFADWKKIKLVVGKVLAVERIEKTDKLYKLQVDVGDKEPIQIVTGLVPYYKEEELMGQKIIVFINLAPATIAGVTSQGMLLCAEREDGSECTLLVPQKDIPAGTPVT